MRLLISRLGKGRYAVLSTQIYVYGSKQHIANELYSLGISVDHIASLFLELRQTDKVSYDCQSVDSTS